MLIKLLERLRPKEWWKKTAKRVLFTGLIAIIGYNLGYAVYNNIKSKKEVEQIQQKIWEESAEQSKLKSSLNEQQEQKIDIIFNENSKSLSREQHKFIEEAVNEIAKGIDSPDELLGLSVEQGKIQTIVSNDTTDTFVDETENKGGADDTEQKLAEQFLTNAGSLYMNNAYIGMFVGTDGTFGSIIATVGSDNTVRIYSRQAFVNTFSENISEIEGEAEQGQTSDNVVTEEQYKYDVYNIISGVYSGKNTSQLKTSIRKYFTEDGESTLLGQASKVKENIASIEPGYIAFARSSLESQNKDKIYLQLETTDKSGIKGYIDLELKLNENNIVYDIDVL